jgi:hypothetical protein
MEKRNTVKFSNTESTNNPKTKENKNKGKTEHEIIKRKE